MSLIVFTPLYRNTQINVALLLTLSMLIYMLHVRPFEDNSLNRQELFNEILVLLANYILYLNTEFVDDLGTIYAIGWTTIGIILFNLVVNLGFMFKAVSLSIKLKCKKKANKKKAIANHKLLIEKFKNFQSYVT